MKKLLLSGIFISLLSIAVNAQTITISAAYAQPVGSTVTVKGIATNGAEFGVIRYIQDSTGGLAVYGSALSGVNRGDSITVTGVTSNYNNLLEMSPVSSFTVNSTANTLPTPVVLTPNQYDDTHESFLIRTDNVVFSGGGGSFAGNTNYAFTANGQSGTVRINNGNPLVGTTIPISPVSFVGILSQFCSTPTTGCTSGYQVLLRDSMDIIYGSSVIITTPVVQSNVATTSFDVSWNTNIASSTVIHYGMTPSLEIGYDSITGNSSSHSITMSGLTPGSIYYVQAISVSGADTAFGPVKVFGTVSLSSGDIKIYFNTPVDTSISTGTNAVYLHNLIDDTLIAYINRVKYSMDIAIYDFDNGNISFITGAINNAYQRGVKVRIISDSSEAATNYGLWALDPGIPQIKNPMGGAYGIMHNKFISIDANSPDPMDPLVWAGSANWTDNQINSDAQNVIIIQDQTLARAYRLEFEEMWGDTSMTPNVANSKFGPYKTDNTPHEFLINGKRVESYFSPSDGVNSKIIDKINSANSSMLIATMLITRTDIAAAITNQVDNNGVGCYVIVDDQTTTTTWSTIYGSIQNHLIDWAPNHIMHNKYMIVDASNVASDPLVWTGSHNWSSSADQKNDENSLVVHDATIANIYQQAFLALYNNSVGLKPTQSESGTIVAYPNPAGNTVTLSALKNNTIQQVAVYSPDGKLVMTAVFNTSEVNQTLDISGLASGIYFVHCKNTNGTEVLRLVKQ